MAQQQMNLLYIGIRGSVLALDRGTGDIVWTSALKGNDFVNITLDGGQLLATTKGEIFCLDPVTGHTLWNNPLKGYGYGLVTIGAGSGYQPVIAEKRRRDAAAAATTTTAAGS
ncbi:MAG: PQQ-binding-like beta-propeller repeat protein [Blastocatellia bacterium]